MAEEQAMTKRSPTWLVALAVPIVALLAIVVTRAVEGPSSSAAANAKADTVIIKNFAFVPPKLTVATGTALKVTNTDGTTHTFSAKNGSFDTGDLDGGKSATVELSQAGTFGFYCKIHNYMTGTLVVK
jgi:plastocyanin